mmetsp:Transcript_19440/g.43861  ORF Transcript_19440/g.43861 Transcript_19440/m.43861 type:complete len:225 (+) Transcript_19440:369-1043(+)
MVRTTNLYERYDAGNSRARAAAAAAPSTGPWDIRDGDTLDSVPYEEWTTPEVVTSIYRHSSLRSKLIALVVLSMISSAVTSEFDGAGAASGEEAAARLRGSPSDFRSRNNADNADSHERSNPYAEEGHTSVMEGALEVKRKGGRKKRAELEAEEARRRYGSKQESLDNVEWDRPPPLKGRQAVVSGGPAGDDSVPPPPPPLPPLELLNDTDIVDIFQRMNATDP